VLITTDNADVNSRALLSRAKLGAVKGGGRGSCFCCVGGRASRPTLPPQKVLSCLLLPSFPPKFSLPLFLPLHCLLPTRCMHAVGHRTRTGRLFYAKGFFYSLFVRHMFSSRPLCLLLPLFIYGLVRNSPVTPHSLSTCHLPSCRSSLPPFALLLFGHHLVCALLPFSGQCTGPSLSPPLPSLLSLSPLPLSFFSSGAASVAVYRSSGLKTCSGHDGSPTLKDRHSGAKSKSWLDGYPKRLVRWCVNVSEAKRFKKIVRSVGYNGCVTAVAVGQR
jgi:hypothetical protein